MEQGILDNEQGMYLLVQGKYEQSHKINENSLGLAQQLGTAQGVKEES